MPHLHDLENRVVELRQRLEVETADVEAGVVLAHQGVGGAEGLARRRPRPGERGAEAARYAVAEAEARRDSITRDRAALQSRLAGLGDVESQYQQAVAAKEAWLAEHDAERPRRWPRSPSAAVELEALDWEAREAHDAGWVAHEPAKAGVGDARQRGRGRRGTRSAWGRAADRHDEVREGRPRHRVCSAARTSRWPRSPAKPADVHLPVRGVQVDQMMRTFDVWFDNIFSDMAVRSRIQDAAPGSGRRWAR